MLARARAWSRNRNPPPDPAWAPQARWSPGCLWRSPRAADGASARNPPSWPSRSFRATRRQIPKYESQQAQQGSTTRTPRPLCQAGRSSCSGIILQVRFSAPYVLRTADSETSLPAKLRWAKHSSLIAPLRPINPKRGASRSYDTATADRPPTVVDSLRRIASTSRFIVFASETFP